MNVLDDMIEIANQQAGRIDIDITPEEKEKLS